MKRILFKLAAGPNEADNSFLSGIEELSDSAGVLSTGEPPVRLFSNWTRDELRALEHRAQRYDPDYVRSDLGAWFVVPCLDDRSDLILQALLGSRGVTHVAVESPPSTPRLAPPAPSRHRRFGHLARAPVGIDIRAARAKVGGRGEGQQLVDIEKGWCRSHEALLTHAIPPAIVGLDSMEQAHGTGTLGIVAGRRPSGRLLGVAPDLAHVRVASTVLSCEPHQFSIATAVLEALRYLDPGDILLLQTEIGGGADDPYVVPTPAEADEVVFQVVRCATALGVTVVAAAGNGSRNLDEFSDTKRGKLFDRDVGDSLAVIVGAADPCSRSRRASSNYGSRVDCFAWGAGVVTACAADGCVDNNQYRSDFDGTSAATAIVAGAAAAVQGVARARFGRRYGPRQLRQLLSDRTGDNTRSARPDKDKIGVMPNLKWILDTLPAPWIRPWEGP